MDGLDTTPNAEHYLSADPYHESDMTQPPTTGYMHIDPRYSKPYGSEFVTSEYQLGSPQPVYNDAVLREGNLSTWGMMRTDSSGNSYVVNSKEADRWANLYQEIEEAIFFNKKVEVPQDSRPIKREEENHDGYNSRLLAWEQRDQKPTMISYSGKQAMCKAVNGEYYIYNYLDEKLEDVFCKVKDAESTRGCSGFDF